MGTPHHLQEVHTLSQHRGGGKFGKVQNSWPFVKLTIEDDSISMKTILQEVRLKREWIQAIILQKYFLNYRFIFKHNEPTIDKVIEFWSFSPDPVVNALKSKGYSVSEGK
jgi:hypothetical protein